MGHVSRPGYPKHAKHHYTSLGCEPLSSKLAVTLEIGRPKGFGSMLQYIMEPLDDSPAIPTEKYGSQLVCL